MAQLAEQLICNQQVIGSSPIIGFYTISYCIYGQIPEWPKGTDCKSAGTAYGGSNPPLPTTYAGMAELADALDSGSSVRLGHAGSSPVSRTKALKTQRFQGFFLFWTG